MMEAMFLCGKNRTQSPSVGIPVYVKNDALARAKFPYDCRGGTIVEDLSFYDTLGYVHRCFKVQHKNGYHVWGADELVEIGAQIDIKVDSRIVPNSYLDH